MQLQCSFTASRGVRVCHLHDLFIYLRDYFGKCICRPVFYDSSGRPFWKKKYLCSVRALVSSVSHRDTTRKYKSFPATSTHLLSFFLNYQRMDARKLVSIGGRPSGASLSTRTPLSGRRGGEREWHSLGGSARRLSRLVDSAMSFSD
jgi:hypothetical protein